MNMKFLLIILLCYHTWTVAVSDQFCKISGHYCVLDKVSENVTLPDSDDYHKVTIRKIQIKGSNLNAIPMEIFEYFPELNSIYLSDQKIKQIKDKTFVNAAKLEYL